ncbi:MULTISPECIES: hypothetical protein [Acidianus]|uniref:Uncharacterized protein n=1 Tax=Candidatus Acidianus copahuensis TaxID=1160895 RepID=A0A031LKZ7_9CREN|nr:MULTISPECIES: hypothetical protein [Acidianus]EZQ04732.1 hypothetical protein CM19_08435 [Candidatus Acidianus copahuensis]NON63028.1 hypothetical protein [Acidianus sp. RZ1]
MAEYRKIFEGVAYSIVEDDEASIVFLEGKPVAASCIKHGNHEIYQLDCPYVEKLLKKVFS